MSKNKYIHIYWTCANLEEAKRISKELLEKKWIACANIIPEICSLYSWKGKIQEDREVKVIFKTCYPFFERVRDYIIEHGSYDIPEISAFSTLGVNPAYTAWLEEETWQKNI